MFSTRQLARGRSASRNPPHLRRRRRVAAVGNFATRRRRRFDAGGAFQAVIETPTYRFEAASLLLLASFASKVGQSPLKRPKARVKPANVSKTEWRAGEIARWELRGLEATSADESYAVAFLQAWAERTCEVGALRARARWAPREDGVRLLWLSRGPKYLSAAEERAREAEFERMTPESREVKRAKSSYAYAARAATTAAGGVDIIIERGDDRPTLSVRRCGYESDREVVKEGSERSCVSLLGRDVACAFDATR